MITETSVLNIASMVGIRDKLSDLEILLFAGSLNHTIRENLKQELCQKFEHQHTWLTNIAVIRLIQEE